MRKHLAIIVILSLCLFTQNAAAQFADQWKVKFGPAEHFIELQQNGDRISGKLEGQSFTATWDEAQNEFNGYFRYERKLYKFKSRFKNPTKKIMLIGKYCSCGGEPDLPIIFTRHSYDHTPFRDENWNREPPEETKSSAKFREFEGRFRITVTRMMIRMHDDGHILDETAEFYGSIGVRLKGKGKSGQVTIKALGNKKPRIWEESSGNPVHIKNDFRNRQIIYDEKGQEIHYCYGSKDIDRMREYQVSGELANSDLMVNIQAKLGESDTLVDDEYPWKQRQLYVRDMKPGHEYVLICKDKKDKNEVYIGFKLERF